MSNDSDAVIGSGGVLKDLISGAAIATDIQHYEIHEGCSYAVSADGILDTNGTLSISFKTAATGKYIHAVGFADSALQSRIEVLESPTITVDTGTDLDVFNRNRNSSNTSTVRTIETVPQLNKMTQDATITADGTVFVSQLLGAGKKVPGQTRDDGEWILKPDTIYSARLTSAEENNLCTVAINWYEADIL
jgi:hypothetical protein